MHGNVPLLRLLIEKQKVEFDARNKVNFLSNYFMWFQLDQTPLHFSILSGSIETVRVFLEGGASFDVADAVSATISRHNIQ